MHRTFIFVALTLCSVAALSGCAHHGQKSVGKNLDVQQSISQSRTMVVPLDRGIPVTIRNASSVGFRLAEVAIKDEQTQTVRTANFGRIEPNTTARQVVQMPGGIEQAAYKIVPDEGDDIVGFGYADNATEVNITIRD